MIIINDLNLTQSPFRGSRNAAIDPIELNSDNGPNNDFDSLFRDTNGDGFFSPLDVLLVINFINSPGHASEGEAVNVFVLSNNSDTVPKARPATPSRPSPRSVFDTPGVADAFHHYRAAVDPSRATRSMTNDEFASAVDALLSDEQLIDLSLESVFQAANTA